MNNIKSIANKIKSIGHNAYVVWSYCVSKVMWIDHYWDTDFATDALPEQVEKVLNVVWRIWKKYWTLIVKEGEKTFEITTFREDIWSINQRRPSNVVFTKDLKQDASRRDFTINALYYDPIENKFIDLFWWINDIKNGIIRFVWDINKRLDEDMLRLLRFVRLRSRLWFKEADENYTKIFKNRILELKNISSERVKEECDKILLTKLNVEWLIYLKEIWFFLHFIPELEVLSKIPWWPRHHLEWDVWTHTLMVIKELNKLNCSDVDIYWACLLHDIWKALTYSFDEEKNIHYIDHDKIWAGLFSKNISRSLKFSNKSSKKIKWLIDNHIRFIHLTEMKKVKAYEFMLHEFFDDLIILGTSDSIWKTPSEPWRIQNIKEFYLSSMNKFKKIKLLTWDDILKKYPNLQWSEIWKKLKEENNKILASL